MLQKIKELLAKQLRIDVTDIADNADIIADLGADSLDIVELLMVLEDELGIVIPDDDVAELKTVSDIAEYIEERA